MRQKSLHAIAARLGVVAVATATIASGAGLAHGATSAAREATRGPNGGQSVSAVSTGAPRALPAAGRGTLTYQGRVNLADLPDASARDYVGTAQGPLRIPRFFTGSDVGSRQVRSRVVASPHVTTPTVVRLNKGGTKNSQSSCFCQPPDPNGAISSTNIVEAVNLALTVYQRGGALVSRKSLASFFPTSRSISDPRILFDNRAKRWILTFIPIPETTSTTPQMFVAVSTGASPTGSYFKYTLSFSGGLFPPGTLLDYPMVGQDINAILIGSNNFQFDGSGFSYIGSAAFAISKANLYAGAGVSFPVFSVAPSTHPSIAKGVPLKGYSSAYWLAANGGGGYTLYKMTGTAGTPTMTQQGTSANGLWSPPPLASQPAPNAAVQLDTLDGRLQAPPTQADTFIWFTHAVNLAGFPAVRYGAISLSQSGTGGLTPTTADAYLSSTSNDWNPSLALSEQSTNSVRVFLNWAVTDPPNGLNVSHRVSGVGPGEGVPSLAGIGKTLFTGSGSPSQTRFGDFSSTSMDVVNVSTSCQKQTQALVVNQVFNGGDWQARLARVGTC